MSQLLGSTALGGFRPREYRAPSWSWASLDSVEIVYGVNEPVQSLVTSSEIVNELLVEVLETDVKHQSCEPTSPITRAYIRIKARLALLT